MGKNGEQFCAGQVSLPGGAPIPKLPKEKKEAKEATEAKEEKQAKAAKPKYADIEDEDNAVTHTGVVSKFESKRGCGMIKGENGEIFVHWKGILSDDRWPKLEEGMEVQYTIGKDEKGKVGARNVCKPGGDKKAWVEKNPVDVAMGKTLSGFSNTTTETIPGTYSMRNSGKLFDVMVAFHPVC